MIAIIGAIQIEVDAIKKYMNNIEERTLNNIAITLGDIDNNQVVLALSGVGKVNAAMCTSILGTNFDLDLIINIGTAGGLLKSENTLDIVVAEKCIQHDFDTSMIDGEEGIGLVSYCDKDYSELASKVLKSDKYKVHIGSIACGDQFIARDEDLDAILNKFSDAIASDMESAAIASVANVLDIKCIVIRSLSDIAHKHDSQLDFSKYAKLASERSAKFVKEYIKLI